MIPAPSGPDSLAPRMLLELPRHVPVQKPRVPPEQPRSRGESHLAEPGAQSGRAEGEKEKCVGLIPLEDGLNPPIDGSAFHRLEGMTSLQKEAVHFRVGVSHIVGSSQLAVGMEEKGWVRVGGEEPAGNRRLKIPLLEPIEQRREVQDPDIDAHTVRRQPFLEKGGDLLLNWGSLKNQESESELTPPFPAYPIPGIPDPAGLVQKPPGPLEVERE